jgi:hypothetical protein
MQYALVDWANNFTSQLAMLTFLPRYKGSPENDSYGDKGKFWIAGPIRQISP